MREEIGWSRELLGRVREEMHVGIVGQERLVDGLLMAVLAGGHALIEGVPGLAKTRAVNLLARMCGAAFRRLQFTPDMLPADIVGTQVYNQAAARFETRRGPVFASFVLADEINRAPAKVQSALLEAMQERQVTIGEETHRLPEPFFVFATQNPIEQEGTYPLPEAQVDRFFVKLVVDYPAPQEEEGIVRMVIAETRLPEVRQVLDPARILALQAAARSVYVEERIVRYARDLVLATRRPELFGVGLQGLIEYGASPRGSICLALGARARALLDGRDAVVPEDVKAVALDVLRHRVFLTYYARAEGVRPEAVVASILEKVKVP